MGFSENLENNLKSLESQEERDPQQIARELARKEAERRERVQAAPFAEQLRNGSYTQGLLAHATRIGFSHRVKVHIAWLDSTLRLEARNLRLELRPTAKGIQATQFADGNATSIEMVDVGTDPQLLATRWLSALQ
jgi:hypothetical protein